MLTQRDIQMVPLAEREHCKVAEAMTREAQVIHPDNTLDDALEHLTNRRVSWMPVVDIEATQENGRVLGVLSVTDIIFWTKTA